MRLHYENNITFFSFQILDESSRLIPIIEWGNFQSEFYSQLSIINELYENGSADYSETECRISVTELLSLSEIDQRILGLPNLYPFEIYIESDGNLKGKDFKLKYGFYNFVPNGSIIHSEKKGCIINCTDSQYLLNLNQYLLCDSIDDFNSLPDFEKGGVFNLSKLASIKKLSTENNIKLEEFLNSQELHNVDKVKIDVKFNEGVLEIFPILDIPENDRFISQFDLLSEPPQNEYSIQNKAGGATRILFDEKQKSELRVIKSKRKISNQNEINEIIERPEIYFNSDLVDLNSYSQRVKEIGLYKPKFYPFVCPYKSQWIPGILIKDKFDGEKKIYFKTEDQLNEFIEAKELASNENSSSVFWKNSDIPFEFATELIAKAKEQFRTPNKPLRRNSTSSVEVLIIKENAEISEYSDNVNENPYLENKFFRIPNLNPLIEIKDHQKNGISWLQSLYKNNCPGALLADDMGLGKTLQLLYFIEWHTQNNSSDKPYLIVAPISLMENWENEYQKFFDPQLLPLVRLNNLSKLAKEYNIEENKKSALSLQKKQIILTNYETLRIFQFSLGLIDFSLVALDEAQKIKTPGTLITNAAKALKADFKIAMTGTPVENTLIDIWCIMDFAVPGLLGSGKEFASVYQNPLKSEETNVQELTEKLRSQIGVYLKRRLKSQIKEDLPKKFDTGVNAKRKMVMPNIQLEYYNHQIELANDSSYLQNNRGIQKLKSLQAIRDISDHPFLYDKQILSYNSDDLISSSAKLILLMNILTEIKNKNEKVIIFAERKDTQKMLHKVIYEKFNLYTSIINGDTKSYSTNNDKSKLSRQQTIDRFQNREGFNAIIMSPIAAGVGLNVTHANHVIHYSRHWNPAKEQQATDRAYRIGQEKDVYVYYPMAVLPDHMLDEAGEKMKSFDEILDQLLLRKSNLASNLLFPTDQAEVTPEDIFDSVFGTKAESQSINLTFEDIDRLQPNLFESYIGVLYQKEGFDVTLTPYSNDKGVDIVIKKKNENYLIQAKQSSSLVGIDAIQEVYTAKKYYESIFNCEFNLLVVTNNYFTSTALSLARLNNVNLISRDELAELNTNAKVSNKEINKLETQRLERI